MDNRQFTLEEANAALRIIRPLIDEMQAIRRAVLDRQPEIWPALSRAAGNGGNSELSKLVKDFDRLNALVHRLHATGAELKDIDQGLVDFRARRGDGEVYLCWKAGEDEIRYWHEIEAGFAGRQPIDLL
jgi:hypothetical protein